MMSQKLLDYVLYKKLPSNIQDYMYTGLSEGLCPFCSDKQILGGENLHEDPDTGYIFHMCNSCIDEALEFSKTLSEDSCPRDFNLDELNERIKLNSEKINELKKDIFNYRDKLIVMYNERGIISDTPEEFSGCCNFCFEELDLENYNNGYVHNHHYSVETPVGYNYNIFPLSVDCCGLCFNKLHPPNLHKLKDTCKVCNSPYVLTEPEYDARIEEERFNFNEFSKFKQHLCKSCYLNTHGDVPRWLHITCMQCHEESVVDRARYPESQIVPEQGKWKCSNCESSDVYCVMYPQDDDKNFTCFIVIRQNEENNIIWEFYSCKNVGSTLNAKLLDKSEDTFKRVFEAGIDALNHVNKNYANQLKLF